MTQLPCSAIRMHKMDCFGEAGLLTLIIFEFEAMFFEF